MVSGIPLEILRRGTGRPIVLLHGFDTIAADAPFLDLLAREREIIAPSCPGFGNSPRPADVTSVYDLIQLHLEFLESLPQERVSLVGFSFGGWIAAEVAAHCSHRIDKLVLVDALGLKLGERESGILDIFNAHPRDVARARWVEPGRFAPDFDRMSDAAIVRHARSRDALALYGWEPYMHNPSLKRWLARIKVPTLVIWGAQDGIVAPDYGKAYAGCIPGARFAAIEGAAHHPEMEEPQRFAALVLGFLEG
jgi:pimeloyl-ACP methyl ester carboxylesterase